MQSEELQEFDLNDFYDILMLPSIKESLKPFVRQFKKHNIPFMHETILNILQIINSKKEAPIMKFNALMATKLLFDTGEYIPVTLIEVYILPIIYQIATYRIQTRSEEGMTQYFIERGYDVTKEMKRLGFNFVLLAVEFMFMSAQIKQYRNLENQELTEPSNYKKLLDMLLQKGCHPIKSYKFFIPSYVSTTRKRFLKKLSRFNPQLYTQFFLKLTCDEFNMNKKSELDLKKMMTFGDAFYTIPLLNICEEELCNMEANFQNKKKYLGLIGEFMKAGDIYAVFILTRSPFLEEIYEKVEVVNGQRGIEAGDKIYPEVQAAKLDKREFYIEFLKNIQIWAYCHPIDEQGDPTDSKKIYDVLKHDKKFIFPPNILLDKIRTQMQANLKANQVRNQKMIKLVDELNSSQSRKRGGQSLRESMGSSKKSDRVKERSVLNSYIEFDEIEEMVVNAKKRLDSICEIQKLQATMMFLGKFKRFWHGMQSKNEIDGDDSDDIGMILQQGALCLQIVELVLPVYELYSKGAIDFQEYIDRVNLLMKTDSDVSVGSNEPSIERNIIEIEEVESEQEQTAKRSSAIKFSSYNVNKSSEISSQKSSNIGMQSKNSQLVSYNDYEVQCNQINKKKVSFKKTEKYNQLNDSVNSSRSRNSRGSRIILERRSHSRLRKQNDMTEQPQYRDIINGDITTNRLEEVLYRNNQGKDSFISSEQSSVKEDQRGYYAKQGSNLHRSQSNISGPANQDYYGQHSGVQKSAVKFSSSSRSSKLRPQPSKRSSSRQKEKSQRQSVLSDNPSMNSQSNSFKIQSAQNLNEYSSVNKESQSSKKQSRFTFTSKDDKKQQPPFSVLSKYQLKDSEIQAPDLLPQLHSYHQPKDQEELLTNPSKMSTFKDVFDINNQIILSKQLNSKVFNFSKGKIVNFIETVYSKTPRNSSIVDMLSQRNARQTVQVYANERMKVREAQTQSQRVRSLDSFNKNMRMKMVLKKQQQHKIQNSIQHPENNQSEPVSFCHQQSYSRQKSETHLNLGIKTVSKEFMLEPAQFRFINTNIYGHYFPKTDPKQQKCLLKSKSLLLKNQQFQIGYVCTKKQSILNITLFITPLKDKIQDVNLLLAHDQNLRIKLSTNFLECININCQEIVTMQVAVDNVPFVLPSLNFKFRKNKKYAHNQMLLSLPCSFNKFVEYHRFSGQLPLPLKAHRHDKISIQPFRYSSKMLHPDRIKQSLNHFSISHQNQLSAIYSSEVYFRGKIFLLQLQVSTRGTLSITGTNTTGDHKDTKFLQFLMITYHQIFHNPKTK